MVAISLRAWRRSKPIRARFGLRLLCEELEVRLTPSAFGLEAFTLAKPVSGPVNYEGSLYGLNNIKAPEAWNTTRGSTKVAVAVVDTGVDYTHPDLYLNIWINQGEIPTAVKGGLADLDDDGLITFRDLNDPANQGPGKITDLDDDNRITGADILKSFALGGWGDGLNGDGNAYVDDLIGWDFYNNDNNPFDDAGHGTHVSGTIGAMGNGTGVVGVSPVVQLIPLKFLNAQGFGSLAGAVAALNYAVDHANISNHSWGYYGGQSDDPIHNVIAAHPQHLIVAAAGNSGRDLDNPSNASKLSYPAAFDLDNIISVASSNRSDRLSRWSNYGATTVDVAAPGESIISTVPVSKGSYASYSGTSMATPHVAGTAALVVAENSSLPAVDIKTLILDNVDAVSTLDGKVVSNGRLNTSLAVSAASSSSTAVDSAATTSTPSGQSSEEEANDGSSTRIEEPDGDRTGSDVGFMFVPQRLGSQFLLNQWLDTGLPRQLPGPPAPVVVELRNDPLILKNVHAGIGEGVLKHQVVKAVHSPRAAPAHRLQREVAPAARRFGAVNETNETQVRERFSDWKQAIDAVFVEEGEFHLGHAGAEDGQRPVVAQSAPVGLAAITGLAALVMGGMTLPIPSVGVRLGAAKRPGYWRDWWTF